MSFKKVFAAVSASALLVFTLGVMTGCNSGPSDEEVIRKSLTEELDQIKNMDDAFMTEMAADMDVDELATYGIDGVEFMKTYLDGFDYKIDEVTVDGNKATAKVTLTCKSFTAYNSAVQQAATDLASDSARLQAMSKDELNQLLGQTVMDALAGVEVAETDQITIGFTKNGNTWTPDAASEQEITTAMLTN